MRNLDSILKDRVLERTKFLERPYESIVECDTFGRQWLNEDNIFHGELGRLFCIYELYKITKNPTLLLQLRTRIDALVGSKVRNFTLAYGRLGLGFLLLELFELTKEEKYLVNATSIARVHSKSSSIYVSLVNSNALFDGISGMIIFYVKLVSLTNAPWIIETLEKCARKILKEFMICEEGYYMYQSQSKRRLHSLSHGDLGVCLALIDLFNVNGNRIFLKIVKGIIDFNKTQLRNEDNIRKPENSSRVIESFERFVRSQELDLIQFCYNQAQGITQNIDVSNLHNEIDQVLKSVEIPESSVAYLNLLLIEKNRIIFNTYVADAINRLSSYLLDRLDDVTGRSFGSGNLGIAYCLFKSMEDPKLTTSIIHFPRNREVSTNCVIAPDSVLNCQLPEFQHMNLIKDFSGTVTILNRIQGNSFDSFLQQEHVSLQSNFIEYAKQVPNPSVGLVAILEAETFAFQLKGRPEYWGSNNLSDHMLVVDELRNLQTEEFLKLRIRVSKEVTLLSREAATPTDYRMTVEEFKQSGKGSFLFIVNQQGIIETRPQGPAKFFLDCFKNGEYVWRVVDHLHAFMLSQSDEVRAIVIQPFVEDELGFKKSVQTFIIHITKHLLTEGLLSLSKDDGDN